MKFKIRNTEVISIRIPGELYYEIMKRADLKKTTVTDYVRNAVMKYMEYKEDKPKGDVNERD